MLWICIGLALLPTLLSGGKISIFHVLINMATAFGFIMPGAYINTGAWSIGNEMVYYAITPLIIILYRRRKLYGNLALLGSFVVAAFFATNLLHAESSLADQWSAYINPFNNLFLYAAGLGICFNFESAKVSPFVTAGLFIGSVLFLCFFQFLATRSIL